MSGHLVVFVCAVRASLNSPPQKWSTTRRPRTATSCPNDGGFVKMSRFFGNARIVVVDAETYAIGLGTEQRLVNVHSALALILQLTNMPRFTITTAGVAQPRKPNRLLLTPKAMMQLRVGAGDLVVVNDRRVLVAWPSSAFKDAGKWKCVISHTHDRSSAHSPSLCRNITQSHGIIIIGCGTWQCACCDEISRHHGWRCEAC